MSSARERTLLENAVLEENAANDNQANQTSFNTKQESDEQTSQQTNQFKTQQKESKAGDIAQILMQAQQQWAQTDKSKPVGARLVQLAENYVPITAIKKNITLAKQVGSVAATASSTDGVRRLVSQVLPDRLKPLTSVLATPSQIFRQDDAERDDVYNRVRSSLLNPILTANGIEPDKADLVSQYLIHPKDTVRLLANARLNAEGNVNQYLNRNPADVSRQFIEQELLKNHPVAVQDQLRGALNSPKSLFNQASDLGRQADSIRQKAIQSGDTSEANVRNYVDESINPRNPRNELLYKLVQADTPEERAQHLVEYMANSSLKKTSNAEDQASVESIISHPVVKGFLATAVNPTLDDDQKRQILTKPLLDHARQAIANTPEGRVLNGEIQPDDVRQILTRHGIGDIANADLRDELQNQFNFKHPDTAQNLSDVIKEGPSLKNSGKLASTVLDEGLSHVSKEAAPYAAVATGALHEGYSYIQDGTNPEGLHILDKLNTIPKKAGEYVKRQFNAAREEVGLGAADTGAIRENLKSIKKQVTGEREEPKPEESSLQGPEPSFIDRAKEKLNSVKQKVQSVFQTDADKPTLTSTVPRLNQPQDDEEDDENPLSAFSRPYVSQDLSVIKPEPTFFEKAKVVAQSLKRKLTGISEGDEPVTVKEPAPLDAFEDPRFVSQDLPKETDLSEGAKRPKLTPQQAALANLSDEEFFKQARNVPSSAYEHLPPTIQIKPQSRPLFEPIVDEETSNLLRGKANTLPEAQSAGFRIKPNVNDPYSHLYPDPTRDAYAERLAQSVDPRAEIYKANPVPTREEISKRIALAGGQNYLQPSISLKDSLAAGIQNPGADLKFENVSAPPGGTLTADASTQNSGPPEISTSNTSGPTLDQNILQPSYETPTAYTATPAPISSSNQPNTITAQQTSQKAFTEQDAFQQDQSKRTADVSEIQGGALGAGQANSSYAAAKEPQQVSIPEQGGDIELTDFSNVADKAAQGPSDLDKLGTGLAEVGTGEFDPVEGLLGAATVATSLYGLLAGDSAPPTPPPYYASANSVEALAAPQLASATQMNVEQTGVSDDVDDPQNTIQNPDGTDEALAAES